MIGHAGHPEVEGTMGQAESGKYLVESPDGVQRLAVRDENHLAFGTQTTLTLDDAGTIIAALKARFPAIAGRKKRRHLFCHEKPPGCGKTNGHAK